jgi:hypothetical protein
VLTIAAALALFSTMPQMASNDLTAQMTPQVSEAPMGSQAGLLAVPFRRALPREQIGVAGATTMTRTNLGMETPPG